MNCQQVRDRLPLLIYGDAEPGEAAALEDHLAGCPACRREQEALKRLSGVLDDVPTAPVQLDVTRLYAEAARRDALRLRRWRRAACALAGLAAVVLVILVSGLEVRVEAHQLVLRWGEAPAVGSGDLRPPLAPTSGPALAPDSGERTQVLRALVHALKTDLERRDQDRQKDIAYLLTRLQALQLQSNERWSEASRSFEALYLLGSRKGD